jgi:hypothetical protein
MKAPTEDMRGSMRPSPDINALSPRERAAARVAAFRAHTDSSLIDSGDDFFIPEGEIPDGWCYEWKVLEVLGKVDHSYQISLSRRGWEPVPADRHPDMMPLGYVGGTITRKGMILMERPMELTVEARRIAQQAANEQIRVKEDQLNAAPPGQFERSNKGKDLAVVKKGFEKIEIED